MPTRQQAAVLGPGTNHVGDIVDDNNTMGSTVVAGGDGSETLLPGGIPLFFGKKPHGT